MAQRKTLAKQNTINNLKRFLLEAGTVTRLQQLTPEDTYYGTAFGQQLLNDVQKFDKNAGQTFDTFIRAGLLVLKNTPHASLFPRLYQEKKDLKIEIQRMSATASHTDKRSVVRRLGLASATPSLQHMLTQPGILRNHTAGDSKIHIVVRNRVYPSPIPNRRFMVEISGDTRTNRVEVNESTGFYVVKPDESVIFVSQSEDGSYTPELIVIRGVADSAPFSPQLFDWLHTVVNDACSERRDVRPTHEGHMVQAGLNTGPRHATILGHAKSYTKKLDSNTMITHDSDVIGAASLTWSLMKAVMPREVTDHVEKRLDEEKLPRLATRNVAEGLGYTIELDGKQYYFKSAERGPPETYMTRGYVAWTHTDAAYCDWAFAFTVSRILREHTTSHGRVTRSRLRNPPLSWPQGGGANFVDTSLKVVVKQTSATAIAFQPQYSHGTTESCGATNHIISIAFSKPLLELWRKAQDGIEIVSGFGAGEGNPDAEDITADVDA